MAVKKVYILAEHMTFQKDSILLNSKYLLNSKQYKLSVEISYPGVMPYLNKVKDDIFKGEHIKLYFESNRLIIEQNSLKFLSKIREAIINRNQRYDGGKLPMFYFEINNSKVPVVKQKEEYIRFLLSLLPLDNQLITIYESPESKAPESLLFKIPTVNNEVLFIWESTLNVSKATYVYISNRNNEDEVQRRIESYLGSPQNDNKRIFLSGNGETMRWLSFHKKIFHFNLEIYKIEINSLISNASFAPDRFIADPNSNVYNDQDLLIETVFIDSFLVSDGKYYLFKEVPLVIQELTLRKYYLENESYFYLNIQEFHNSLNSSNVRFKDTINVELELPYKFKASPMLRDILNTSVHIDEYNYIGVVFYELNGTKVTRSRIILNQSIFMSMGKKGTE